MYRRMFETIKGVYMNPNTRRIILSNLEGRIQFQCWCIHNIVANAHAGCRPNLQVLVDLACDVTDWNPELFPGLHLLVWLKPKSLCKCKRKKKNRSCVCNCRVVLFDTGKMIITGCRDLASIDESKNLVRLLLQDPRMQDTSEELPRHLRFDARREKMLEGARLEFAGFTKKKRVAIDEEILIDYEDNDDTTSVTPTQIPIADPFVRACVEGQVDNVKFILSYDTSGVQRAIDYIEQNVPKAQHSEIIMALLRQVQK